MVIAGSGNGSQAALRRCSVLMIKSRIDKYEWDDTNNIIVLYPQAVPIVTITEINNQGCWDWWGYDDPNYAVKSGRQVLMTTRMVDRITSGYKRKGKPLVN